MSDEKLYRRNTILATLEPYYSRHVAAMTAETLNDKSEIAAELARRDKAIVTLNQIIESLEMRKDEE